MALTVKRGVPDSTNAKVFTEKFTPMYLQGMLLEHLVYPHAFR